MATDVTITTGEIILQAELFDTPCAKAIAAILPITAQPNVWGDEFYFTIPIDMPLDDTGTASVTVGDIGFWQPGNALVIFFGPTPLSAGPNPVPAGKVNLVGRITGDANWLGKRQCALCNTRINRD